MLGTTDEVDRIVSTVKQKIEDKAKADGFNLSLNDSQMEVIRNMAEVILEVIREHTIHVTTTVTGTCTCGSTTGTVTGSGDGTAEFT